MAKIFKSIALISLSLIMIFMLFVSCSLLIGENVDALSGNTKVSKNDILSTVTSTKIYKKESLKSDVVTSIKKGTTVKATAQGKSKYWVKVKTMDNKYSGYMKKKDLKYPRVVNGIRATYYCACPSCNGSWSSWRKDTWSTATAIGMRLYNLPEYKYKYCAATKDVANLGETLTINIGGVWRTLKVVDRLGASYGYKVDIFYPGHDYNYKNWGVHTNKTAYIG